MNRIEKKVEFMDDGYCSEFYVKYKSDGTSVFDGLITSYYPSGNIYWTRCLLDGIEHGPYIIFWENGNVFLESNYNYGTLDGEYKEYYKSGLLREHSYYVNGEKISLNDYKKQIRFN